MTSFAGTRPLLMLAWRRDRWVLVVSILVMALTAASSMAATLDLYPTDAEAAAGARVMADNPSVTALYGPLPALTAEGVGILKTVMLGSLFSAFLAFAVVRRHTRTEEEEGRLELVAAGVVGRRAPLAAAVLLAALAVLASGLASGLSLLPTGVDAGGAVALAVVEVVAGLVMTGVTAVAVQLTTTTRGAGGVALGVLGAAYLIRALADTRLGAAHRLVWLSFLGWAEEVRPFGDNRVWLLAPAVALGVALLGVADLLLQRRDLGSGLWPERRGPAHAGSSLGTPLGLAWRLHRGALVGWSIAYAVVGMVVGSLATSVEDFASSPGVEQMLRQLSGGHGSLLDVFFGTELRFLAVGAAAYAVTTVLRLHAEESAGRAEVVLAGPVARTRWLASHAFVAATGSAWLLLVAGACAGLTAGLLTELLAAALATYPAVLVCLALAVALFALVPRWSSTAWALLAAFVLLGELGQLLKLPDWLLKASPFAHLGSLPGGSANAPGLTALAVVAVAVTALGAGAFRRRDLAA